MAKIAYHVKQNSDFCTKKAHFYEKCALLAFLFYYVSKNVDFYCIYVWKNVY